MQITDPYPVKINNKYDEKYAVQMQVLFNVMFGSKTPFPRDRTRPAGMIGRAGSWRSAGPLSHQRTAVRPLHVILNHSKTFQQL